MYIIMPKKFRTLAIHEEIKELIQRCGESYLQHHPEMKGIPLSNSKILLEVCTFYLNND